MKNILVVFFTVVCVSSSCNKFLDVSDELQEQQTFEKIFSNPSETRRWHRNIYTGLPNTMNFFWMANINSQNRLGGSPWQGLSDEFVPYHRSQFPYTRPLNPSDNAVFGRWKLYQLIRQANVFLQRAVEIPFSGDADYLSLQELEDLKTQARFLRAYYHYLLFELYGPVPIIDHVVDPNQQEIDFARNSVDEVVDFIDRELKDVAYKMPDPQITTQQTLALPTKGAALAIRARLWVYAASPLFNGGYQEAVALRDKEGKQLFPAFDQNKWNKALEVVEEFIDYANSGHYELHKEFTGGVLDPDKSLYELHMKFNKEMILVRSDDQGVVLTSGPVGSIDRYLLPRGARGGTTNTGGGGILQELVDAFYMNDGLSIKESAKYSESGFSVAGEDVTGRTTPGTHRMFVNREPRFYQTVFYNGRKWHIGGETIFFNKGGNSDNSGAAPFTGHLPYKRVSQKVYHQAPHPNTEYRPMVIFRLAEMYLLYAEVLNEVDPSNPKIVEYVDNVRARAGIPLLADIKPAIIGDQQQQREAIRQEVRVELAMEGQRYFDVKRWMIVENVPGKGGLGGNFTGMDMNATSLDGFYTRKEIQFRVFERKEYLFPLPMTEIQKSNKLIQNPGY